ncbi:MAG: DsbA family protein [Mycobacterium leprae]
MSTGSKQRVQAMRERQAAAARRRRLVVTAVVVALVAAAAVIVAIAVRSSRSEAVPRNTRNGAIVVGAASAPVHVEVFEDFQCPACKAFEAGAAPVLRDVATRGTARVSYYVLSFIGPESVRAANAAACAADVSPAKFADLHDRLYAQQPPERTGGFTTSDLVAAGRAVGLGDDYAGCVREERFRDWVDTVNREQGPRIKGTPTVFLDGRELPREDYAAPQLRAAIDAAARSSR